MLANKCREVERISEDWFFVAVTGFEITADRFFGNLGGGANLASNSRSKSERFRCLSPRGFSTERAGGVRT